MRRCPLDVSTPQMCGARLFAVRVILLQRYKVWPARPPDFGPTGSLLEKQGWCQSCRLSAQAQGDLGALTRLLDGPTGQHRPIGHCRAARQPQDAEGGLYVHLADRRQHRPQRRVAGVMLSRSTAALGLLHVDWFDLTE